MNESSSSLYQFFAHPIRGSILEKELVQILNMIFQRRRTAKI
jgi:hypothetical protein